MADLVAAAQAFVASPAYLDLTLRQLALLGLVVDEEGPHRVMVLADRLGVQKPVITRSVNRLSAFGLVSRSRPAHDKRECHVAATDAGRALRAALAEGLA